MKSERVEIKTRDGVASGTLTVPDGGNKPGVVMLTDIFGLRPAFDDLVQRVAAKGYAVLSPNIFYRFGEPPFFKFPVDFDDQQTLDRMKDIRTPLNRGAILSDGSAYIDFISSRPEVRKGKVGVVGFCLSGLWSLVLAAHRPNEVGAAASFHGGGLATEAADSPHLELPKVKANLYFGHAQNDRSMPVEAIDRLDHALKEWGGDSQSETYPAGHGWMFPGREVYDETQAEIGFEKLVALLDRSLSTAEASV
jgi:carboxymethylenebutenolidase